MPEPEDRPVSHPEHHAPEFRERRQPPHEDLEQEVVYREMTQIWAGPMPPSFELESLNRVVPGLAREVADEFRAEAKHRRKIENRSSIGDLVGMVLGYIMAGAFAAGCFLIIWHAIDARAYSTAGIIAAGALVAGISAFRSVKSLQRKSKAEQDDPDDDDAG